VHLAFINGVVAFYGSPSPPHAPASLQKILGLWEGLLLLENHCALAATCSAAGAEFVVVYVVVACMSSQQVRGASCFCAECCCKVCLVTFLTFARGVRPFFQGSASPKWAQFVLVTLLYCLMRLGQPRPTPYGYWHRSNFIGVFLLLSADLALGSR